MTYVVLNGKLLPAAQAAVPVADRGFRFGDGAFETIRLQRGVPYQWELHVQRLRAGLAALRIAPPSVDWKTAARQIMRANNAQDGFLRISVSRGVGSQGYAPTEDCGANWAMETMPHMAPPHSPYRLWLSSLQKIPPQCLPLNHKLAQGVNNTLALLEAKENQCDEALQLTMDGDICEVASANIFWISEGKCFTPALTTNCLAGTTRAAVMRLSTAPIHEIMAPLDALEHADAVCITNVRLGIQAVSEIQPMGWKFDAKHPWIQAMQAALADDLDAYTTIHAQEWASL